MNINSNIETMYSVFSKEIMRERFLFKQSPFA